MAKTSQRNLYENLAHAIVLTAVEDYQKALRRYSKNPDSRNTKADVDELERFLSSGWYSVLTSIEG